MGKKKTNEITIETQNPVEETDAITFSDGTNINEDLYAPLGNVTFNKNDESSTNEDLYAPFGDKTFNKDALMNNDTSNSNETTIEQKEEPSNINLEQIKKDNEYLNHLDENIIKENIKQKKTYDEQNQFDFDLIKNYMGENYKSFLSQKFNLYAFLCGFFYLLYRKVYLYGITLLILEVALITYYIESPLILICIILGILLINTLIGFKFNKYYVKRSYKQIKSIQNKFSSNRDEYVLSKCSEYGGTSIQSSIIIPLIFGVLIIIAVMQIK